MRVGVPEEEEEEMLVIRIKTSAIPEGGLDTVLDIDHKKLNEELARQALHTENLPTLTYSFVEDPKVQLQLRLVNTDVYVTGTISAVFDAVCSRCADDIQQTTNAPITYLFRRYTQGITDADQEEGSEVGFYDGIEIELGPVLKDNLLLALPFSALCFPDCQGVCSQCGANKNRENCRCAEKEESLGGLAMLRKIRL